MRGRHHADSIAALRTPPDDPPEPIGAVIRRLRIDRGWSQEALAFEVRSQSGASPTAGAIGQIERGVTRPRPETLEGITRALDLAATEVPEYRLAIVRRLFDERAVGLDQAIANLNAFEQAFDYPLDSAGRERSATIRRPRGSGA